MALAAITGRRMMPRFCRDCLTDVPQGRRCAKCGGPRIACHEEIDQLGIAHLDCDAFYAAVEKRDNPDLGDQPLIIGGGRRGVVSTACYIARTYGIGSAMPMFKALKACPHAIVMRPNMKKYAYVAREVRGLMQQVTPLVEPLSIDEAFLDLNGTERLHGTSPARTMAALANRIENEIGITVSVGLSHNKFLAKIASDLDKPRGFSVIGRDETLTFLADKPVTMIWGVGKSLNRQLARDGIRLIGQLQDMEEAELLARYGSMGSRLFRLARGEDARSVHPGGQAKSISSETTFRDDLAAPADLERHLWSLCEKVAARCKAKGIGGRTVVLKLKTADFKSRTRNRKLPDPTQLSDVLFRVGRDLLRPEADGTPFRLIGIGLSSLEDGAFADPPDLLDPMAGKRADAERAMDTVRGRFGDELIQKGIAIPLETRDTSKVKDRKGSD